MLTTLFPELAALQSLMQALWMRLDVTRRDERGMTTETVLITAGLAAAALLAAFVIYNKVSGKASGIGTNNDMNSPTGFPSGP